MNSLPEIALDVRQLCCRYPDSESSPPALDGIDLTVSEGDFVVVSGPNGAGKSSLLGCMSGVIPKLVKAQVTGTRLIQGQPVEDIAVSDLVRIVGVVLEDPDAQLFGATVLEYLAFGLELSNFPADQILTRTAEVARMIGIDSLLDRRCQTLSGGEKQRAVVASMLLLEPRIIVLDEPTSQLDPLGTTDLFESLRRLNRELGLTIVVASHELAELADMATHLVVLDKGRQVAYDTYRNVLGQSFGALLRLPQATEFHFSCRDSNLSSESTPPVTLEEGVAYMKRMLAGDGGDR